MSENNVVKLKERISKLRVNSEKKSRPLRLLDLGLENEGQAPTPARRRESFEKRKEAWKADEVDPVKLENLTETFLNFFRDHWKNRVRMSRPRELTQDEIDIIASELKDIDEIITFLTARKEMAKEYVFTSLTETYSQNTFKGDDTPPDQLPGSLVSDKEGMTLNREGGRRSDPSLNEQLLQAKIGEEKFRSLCNIEVVPEHEVVTFDEEKLLTAVLDGGIDMEDVRECLVPGKYSSPRFVPRRKAKE